MNLELKTEDLKVAITEYLKSQGFSMKNREVELDYKIKYLGKGMGYDVTTRVEITDAPAETIVKPKLDPVIEADEEPDTDNLFGA